jgi:uncharacterized membrane protein YfcA
LCCCFCRGFIDAIVGGGGLIQTPAGLILLPNLPVSTVIGTLIPAFSGTSFAAYQYLKNDGLEIITHNGIGCVARFRFHFTYL